jgi:hypothetical protein
MSNLELKIIGNGGCLNNGLPYNSFIINDDFLVEVPPDIMLSIHNLGIDINPINTIFISHLHGDHTFGIPFLIISKWILSAGKNHKNTVLIYGPEGIEAHVFQLIESAFSIHHPCFQWSKNVLQFVVIDENTSFIYNGYCVSFFELEHVKFTYGLKLTNDSVNLFSYIADSCWCHNIESILNEKPKIVLIDMNGVNNVHISRDEVIEKGLSITGKSTLFYGTHLFELFENVDQYIHCAKTGQVIKVK